MTTILRTFQPPVSTLPWHWLLLLVLFPNLLLAAELPFVGTNVANGKPVVSSGPTYAGLSIANLTDGNPATFTHPAAATGTLNYFFEVDLGRVFTLEGIVLRNRSDGCCTERLSNYGVEIYDDQGGSPGTLNWSARIRTNRSNSGVGGLDIILATNHPTGKFSGRFVRVVNRSSGGYNPQIAEIEVYGALPPLIQFFEADEDVLNAGQTTTLRWEVQRATSAFLSEAGQVNATNGRVEVVVSTSKSYTLTASNAVGTTTSTVNLGVGVVLQPPLLTEFLTDNAGGLKDEQHRSPDWIELSNPNSYSLTLEGYSLTDDPTNRTQWIFPKVRIRPQGRLIVFASGENRRDPSFPLHTNFKLDVGGDFLALVDRDGRSVLQSFPASFPNPRKFPKQSQNISYGIDPDGKVGFFRPPTPGALNGKAAEGIVGDIVFSAERGFYTNAFELSLTCSTPGAVILYTTNSTEPGLSNGMAYASTLLVTNTAVVRAAAFKDRWASTPVSTHTFIFPSNVVRSSSMSSTITRNAVYGPQMVQSLLDLPTVSVVSKAAINDTTEVGSSFEWIPSNGKPSSATPCGARLYGGAFTDFEKKSFRLYFRSDYGSTKLRQPLFEDLGNGVPPAEEFDEIELRSGSHDMSQRGFYFSNIFVDDTLLEMGRLNPHGRFVHLYRNGVYWGVYHLRERWGATMHSRYLGGTKDDFESINGNWNVGGWADPGTPYDGDGSIWEKTKSLRSNYNAVRDYLDVPDLIDYMITWMFGGCEDEYRCVGPRFPGSGLKFYINDADGWFCGSYYCAADDRTVRDAPGRRAGDGPGSLFSMLYKEGNPEYRTILADRIHAALFNGGPLSSIRTLERLERRSKEMERPFLAEAARWQYLSPSEWASRRNEAKNDWLLRRPTEVLAQWRNAGFYPKLDAPQMGGSAILAQSSVNLSFKGPTNTPIYFTLNGEDPRLAGGNISPNAVSNWVTGVSETLLATGSVWRWYSRSNGLGGSDIVAGRTNWSAVNWKHPDYDDSGWNEGRSEFGYGDGDEATVIPSLDGTNKLITAYFRRPLVLEQTADLIYLSFQVKRDDGVIVYVNGAQVIRNGVANGTLNGNSPGSLAADDGQTFLSLPVAASFFKAGTNTLAVELHQSVLLDDATFDMEIRAIRARSSNLGGPFLAGNTVIKARSRLTNQWSALNTSFIQKSPNALPTGSVVLSEVHYHPIGVDSSEFVELANISKEAVNLRGAELTEGIHFRFVNNRDTLLAPGQRLILAADVLGFQQVYGNRIPLEGRYTGDLSNSGDSVLLVDLGGERVSRMAYSDIEPWPSGADGAGYSLVLSHPSLGLTNAAAWRLSSGTNGTPGRGDSVVFTGVTDVDLDGDGLPAQVEYALGTSDSDLHSGPGSVISLLQTDGLFVISFTRNLQADDFWMHVEASANLVDWEAAQPLSSSVGPGVGITTERWGVKADRNYRFLKLVVEMTTVLGR